PSSLRLRLQGPTPVRPTQLLAPLLQRPAPQYPEQPRSHPAHASSLRQRVASRGTSRTHLLVLLERRFPPPPAVSVSFRPRTLRGGLLPHLRLRPIRHTATWSWHNPGTASHAGAASGHLRGLLSSRGNLRALMEGPSRPLRFRADRKSTRLNSSHV